MTRANPYLMRVIAHGLFWTAAIYTLHTIYAIR